MNFNNLCGKVADGMIRMSIDGGIAVKTGNGYKVYKNGNLVNCDQFVFDIGQELVMYFPTNDVKPGDIIRIADKPHYVIKVEDNLLTVLCYEDGSIKQLLPERHMFLGNQYMYCKVVNLLGNLMHDGDPNAIMKMMLMSQMVGGNMNNPMAMMMMLNGGAFDGMFGGLFGVKGGDK